MRTLIAAAILAIAGHGVAHADLLAARLDARVAGWRAALDSLRAPGLAVAVIRGDSVVWSRTLGYRDLERRLPVTANTLFYIASCTKPFVAATTTELAHRGALRLDDPLRRALPRFQLADSAATDTLTLRDLLCHRASLASERITFGEAYTGQMTEERYWRLLARVRPSGEWEYSNLHYTLTGRAIAAATGSRWQTALRDVVLRPAGMMRTTTSATRLYADSDVAIPYERAVGGVIPCPLRKTDRTMHAAGGMGSTLGDLARWVRLHLNGGTLDGRRVLAADVVREMQQRAAPVSDEHPLVPEHRRVGAGLGWDLREHRGVRVVTHNGRYDGASAVFSLLPESGAGVVVLCNLGGPGMFLCEAVAAEAYDAILGLAPADVAGRLMTAAPAMFHDPPADTARGRLELPARRYAGRFVNDDRGLLEFAARGDSLTARIGALPLPLSITGPGTFVAGGEYPGRFERNAAGRVSAVTLAMPETARFVRR